METKTDICGMEHVKWLDNGFRRLLQNPRKLFGRYIRPGSVVFDIGCGPGAFTRDLAEMVGPQGQVVAIDVQEAMLAMVEKKIDAAGLAGRVTYHRCSGDAIAIDRKADFIVTFYMVHETPDPMRFVDEVGSLLNPGGVWFLAEPKVHVTEKEYRDVVDRAVAGGLTIRKREGIISRIAVFRK
ncbi:MAG: class I SAM-dependent methyltransferase [Chitinispirillaceae bacterium]|nr:class I SAM-dependent methyltransferase [Chitinispirillaceae bacterium]